MQTLKPPLPDEMPISNGSQESGLWLWRGETPSPAPLRSRSRVERVSALIVSAARSAPWMAPTSGLALIGFAAWAILHLLPGDPSPGNMSAAAPHRVVTPRVARLLTPAPPPLTEAPLDQEQAQSTRVIQSIAIPTHHRTVKWRSKRRSQLAARRSPAPVAHRWASVLVEPCRYQCDWAQGMAWHGGGD